MKSHFEKIEQVSQLFRLIIVVLGAKPARNQSTVATVPSPAYHPADRSSLVSDIELLYWFLVSDEPTGRLALVFELMEMNLYEAIKGRTTYLPESRVKLYMYQLLKAIEHMHRNGIFHRDIKP